MKAPVIELELGFCRIAKLAPIRRRIADTNTETASIRSLSTSREYSISEITNRATDSTSPCGNTSADARPLVRCSVNTSLQFKGRINTNGRQGTEISYGPCNNPRPKNHVRFITPSINDDTFQLAAYWTGVRENIPSPPGPDPHKANRHHNADTGSAFVSNFGSSIAYWIQDSETVRTGRPEKSRQL